MPNPSLQEFEEARKFFYRALCDENLSAYTELMIRRAYREIFGPDSVNDLWIDKYPNGKHFVGDLR